MASSTSSFISNLLRRRYGALALALSLAVWGAMALAMRPLSETGGGFATYPYGLTTALENRALDLLFQLRDARDTKGRTRGLSEPITIIEVDEASIRASNVRLQKWPRDWYARLVERAREGGAKVVGLDIYLSETGGTSEVDERADRALADALYETENVVIAQKLAAGGIPAVVPLQNFSDDSPAFGANATAIGFVDFPFDSDNFVRSAQLFHQSAGEQIPQFSFGAALAQLYSGEELKNESEGVVRLGERVLPLRNDVALQLDFRGRTPAFQRVAAKDILFDRNARLPEDIFRDRIVIIGATNTDAPDQFPTSFYEPLTLARLFDGNLPRIPARTPGVELHATVAATLLFGEALTRPTYGRQILLMLVPLALVALAVFALRALWGFLASAAVAVGLLAVSSWAFDSYNLILPLATGWLGVAVLAPLGFVLRYAHERAVREEKEAERAQIMDIFSRCVSAEVAEELWQKRGGLNLVGESRIVTIIFTDIRGFTTLSESVNSEEVVAWLNDYFSRMHHVVCAHGGHINKFIGDGLMIVFGAPVDRGVEREARAAVACGMEMLAAVERLNA
ncbi:MAG: adenylate/guanylate cyclase domain-containing protein, partial [Pyrinomonadaceae bacterium]